MPEAYSECQDVVDTIRRHRPDWLLATPDLSAYHRRRTDWVGSGGFWGRARRDPAWKSAILKTLEADVFDRARADAERRRSEFAHIPFDKLTLTGWTVRGPGGATTEPWRIETADVWWTALSGRAQRAYLDWCEPFLDLRKVSRSRGDWDKLWFEAAEMTDVPREWLRWATRWLQGTRRVTAGTPGDNQLAAYLTEADVLVTGDKAFVDIVDRVRTDAPFTVARPVAYGLCRPSSKRSRPRSKRSASSRRRRLQHATGGFGSDVMPTPLRRFGPGIGPGALSDRPFRPRQRPAFAGLSYVSGRQDAKGVVGGLRGWRGRFRGRSSTVSPRHPSRGDLRPRL